MKVVFHPKYHEVYTSDPASAAGRMLAITKVLEGIYEFVEPKIASDEDIQLVHSKYHIQSVAFNSKIYEIAKLAVGGAIKASEIAMDGEPAFGLIRPPGHHASPNSCWGFCYFNNIAIAVSKLLSEQRIKKAFILDFDLHYGDGTANAFSSFSSVTYFHPKGSFRGDFIEDIERRLKTIDECDIVAVSAGFDRHEDDWGGMLTTEDYKTIGKLLKEFALEKCQGRRFGVLEGGYNHNVLGINVKSFLEGFDGS
ncbi:MAG: hypothetical protein N2511_01280 [Thermodesulfovibrionales bacterium]|nr:hypothetical protein [Thermodesulfovibrionales bacterium]